MAVGGAVGTWARLGIAEALTVEAGRWPWGTLAANLAGCALLGYAATRMVGSGPRSVRAHFLGTGLCGGLTTFSALQLEVVDLVRDGHGALGGAYLAASVLLGLAAVTLGQRAARVARPS